MAKDRQSSVPIVKSRASRKESDVPTLIVAGLVLTAGVLGGFYAGVAGAGMGSFAALILFGGLYTALAWFFGWPKMRWDFLSMLLP